MAIRVVEMEQAGEAERPVYDRLTKKSGRVLNFFKMIAHKPGVLAPFVDFYSQVWAAGVLPVRIKELAYLRTSLMNGCEY